MLIIPIEKLGVSNKVKLYENKFYFIDEFNPKSEGQ